MKRILLTAGILLFPLSVHAEALSPWVQQVLDRTDEGMSLADGLTVPPCNETTKLSEIQNMQSLIRELSIPSLYREQEVASLRERTVCYQSDRHLLERKIRDVQEAMIDAAENCEINGTKALRETYRFIIGAYASFLEGGTNPSFVDDRLRFRHPFHDTDLWNAGAADPVALTGSTAPLCPYTTDYGVHSIGYIPTSVGGGAAIGGSGDIRSFGCDQEVLASIPDPYADEAQTLNAFMGSTRDLALSLYNTVSRALFNLNNTIGLLTGTIPPDAFPGAQDPPPHAEQEGCLKPSQSQFSSANPADIDALLSAYPDYFEAYNLREDSSGNPTYDPTFEETLPVGMLHVPVVDYFLSVPNAGILMRSYIDLRAKVGAGRPLPNYLVGDMFDSYLNAITRGADTPTKLKQISANIEREMGIFEAGNTDALQRMQDASVPLESAVQSLIFVVEEQLPKKYIPELTFFLARSCVDGHCQRTLDTVAKRVFNPYCHPYVSGIYMEEDVHKKCFCYPEIESEDETFWKKYCSADYSEDMDRYDDMEPEMIPACVEESLMSSSSSSAP